MRNAASRLEKLSVQFWLLAVYLTIVFLTGGSSRSDVQSLMILQPVSYLFGAVALATLKLEDVKRIKSLVCSIAAVSLLLLIHLVPLPPMQWYGVPPTNTQVQIASAELVSPQWWPIAVSPVGGWQAISSLVPAIVIISFGCQIHQREHRHLLPVIMLLISVSALLGLFQLVAEKDSVLYLYDITNSGEAVGLFANRNHAATMLACLFPILALFSTGADSSTDIRKDRYFFSAGLAVVLVPLILVTGSRSGFLTAVFGIVGAILLYRNVNERSFESRGEFLRSNNFALVLWGTAIFILGLVTFLLSRATALERLFGQNESESRSDFMQVSASIFLQNSPLGVGSGSFVEAYKVYEPTHLLDLSYLNRAHNDWLETAVNFGIPGVLMMLVFLCAFIIKTSFWWKQRDRDNGSIALGRTASIAMGIILMASVGDYPLRTPIMTAFFALLLVWMFRLYRVESGNFVLTTYANVADTAK